MAASQGTRTVICSKHGIPYDASKRGGCSRCIQEWERQKSPPARGGSGFPTPIKLLGLLLVVGGFYVLATRKPEQSEPAPTTAPPPPAASRIADSEAAEALRRIVGALPALITAGRSEAEVHMSDSSDPQQQREDWQFWTLDWNGRLANLRSTLPEAPDSSQDLKLAVVYQDVSKAFDELQALTQEVQDGVPDVTRVRKRFENAEKALEKARNQLSQ